MIGEELWRGRWGRLYLKLKKKENEKNTNLNKKYGIHPSAGGYRSVPDYAVLLLVILNLNTIKKTTY